MSRRRVLHVLAGGLATGVVGCSERDGDPSTPTASEAEQEDADAATLHRVEAAYHTDPIDDGLDQPAVWHGPDGDRLLVTAKQSHELVVFDATDGSHRDRIGGPGDGPGEFRRPNGLFVIDDLAVVVERDNRRVQVLRLPGGEPLGTFGDGRLRRPYEGMVTRRADGYDVFVTDDYDADGPAALDERIKHYRFRVVGGEVVARHVRSFGATEPPGALRKVESIYADPRHDRLVVADEADGAIKRYRPDGRFQGVATSIFAEDHQPEGITLHPDADCYLFTEQGPPDDAEANRFHLFARDSFAHQASFYGPATRHTDGVWLTTRPVGAFDAGAFFAVDDDTRVAAFEWADIARLL